MQQPPFLWGAPPPIMNYPLFMPQQQQYPPARYNQPQSPSSDPQVSDSPQRIQIPTNEAKVALSLQGILKSFLDDTWHPDPMAIGIILLALNLIKGLVPDGMMKRLKTSWDLFWPPWQDRSAARGEPAKGKSIPASAEDERKRPSSSDRDTRPPAAPDKAKDAKTTSQSAEPAKETSPLASTEKVAPADTRKESPSEKPKEKSRERPEGSNKEEVKKERSEGSTRERSKERPEGSTEERPEVSTKERPEGSTKERPEQESKEKSKAPSGSTDPTASNKSGDKPKNEVKKASAEPAKKPEDGSIAKQIKDKERETSKDDKEMSQEKPKDKSRSSPESRTPDKKGSESESEKAQKLKEDKALDPVKEVDKGKTRMEGERPHDKTPSKADKPPSDDTPQSPSSSASDTNDALMSGDYRPLKSALKKSKKKPKQTNNIHHNFFMTMRGFRPALIPFPHGFHPKPHYPRNTLWWNNVPKNADHIMAAPKVAKEPDKGDTDDGKEEASKGTPKEPQKEKKDEKKDEKPKPASSKPSSDAKDDGKSKEKELARAKAEAEAKAKAKKEAELKAAKSGSSSSSSAAVSKPSASASAAATAKPKSIPLNPELEKATYITQGLLCVLLYYLHQQLAFLLVAFFAWQYIDKQYTSLRPTEPPKTAVTSSSSSKPPPNSSTKPFSASSTDIDPAMKAKLDEARKSREAKERPVPKEDPASSSKRSDSSKAQEDLEKLEILIKKLKSRDDATDDTKERIKSAIMQRDALVARIQKENERPRGDAEKETKARPEEPSGHSTKGEESAETQLLEKLKAAEMYAKKYQAVESPTDEHRERLRKAEELRKELKAKLAELRKSGASGKTVRAQEAKAGADSSYTDASKGKNKVGSEEEGRDSKGKIKIQDPASSSPDKKDLETSLKEMDLYVRKYRAIDNPDADQKDNLTRAEAKRNSIRKQLLRVFERSTKDPSSVRAVSGDTGKGDTAHHDGPGKKLRQMRDEIKQIEAYIIKHRKLDNLTEEQKTKVASAEKKRKAMKAEASLLEKQLVNIGSSGLTADEKAVIPQSP
ncbi:hypothetical protein L198_01520 [Cryptococcus wingfieldii CBS 7118]|uniref:Uncharacterized protein n=1 Tax=Cryptococcus wingfieldii CBS 7118 TaxID=1295528 RepID=A0A1E3JZG7_9TREE|nr:hypothetical protein L198_01520 [Cryptococcus wingfieldii CBS 7118]ODO06288.1 hypothetical protein L198_01520 [Cryptococcus wingfieldii CBS 7118]